MGGWVQFLKRAAARALLEREALRCTTPPARAAAAGSAPPLAPAPAAGAGGRRAPGPVRSAGGRGGRLPQRRAHTRCCTGCQGASSSVRSAWEVGAGAHLCPRARCVAALCPPDYHSRAVRLLGSCSIRMAVTTAVLMVLLSEDRSVSLWSVQVQGGVRSTCRSGSVPPQWRPAWWRVQLDAPGRASLGLRPCGAGRTSIGRQHGADSSPPQRQPRLSPPPAPTRPADAPPRRARPSPKGFPLGPDAPALHREPVGASGERRAWGRRSGAARAAGGCRRRGGRGAGQEWRPAWGVGAIAGAPHRR